MVNVDEEGEDALAIGYVLVGLHCAFVVHSLFCVGHIVMDVRRAATEVEGPDASSDAVVGVITEVATEPKAEPTVGGSARDAPVLAVEGASRVNIRRTMSSGITRTGTARGSLKYNAKVALHLRKGIEAAAQHDETRKALKAKLDLRKTAARARLKGRVRSRSRGAIVLPVQSGRASAEASQLEKRELAPLADAAASARAAQSKAQSMSLAAEQMEQVRAALKKKIISE